MRAVADAGADAIEIGIPFSDPVMDGRTVQEASQRALELGATPAKIVAEAGQLDIDVPLAVMTYCNPVQHAGLRAVRVGARRGRTSTARSCPTCRSTSSATWADAADAAGVETVLLAAPPRPTTGCAPICERSRGFVYGVSLMGVTGERDQVASQAREMGQRCKAVTDLPVLLGRGHLHARRRRSRRRASPTASSWGARSYAGSSTAAGPRRQESSYDRYGRRWTHDERKLETQTVELDTPDGPMACYEARPRR